jgi:probable phosphoglycerate mutase
MPPTGTGGCRETMPSLEFLRHGPTDWSAAKRLQGRSDIGLSDHGRMVVAAWRLPAWAAEADWVTSPLRRCVETAEILRRVHSGAPAARVEPRLTEMSFGDWEGWTLADLRAAHGTAMTAREAMGLDFRAPGGESPRDVQSRLMPWLNEIAAAGRPVLAVAHKGVIRAVYALAAGWDMRDKPPDRLLDEVLHMFELDSSGIRLAALNIALTSTDSARAR